MHNEGDNIRMSRIKGLPKAGHSLDKVVRRCRCVIGNQRLEQCPPAWHSLQEVDWKKDSVQMTKRKEVTGRFHALLKRVTYMGCKGDTYGEFHCRRAQTTRHQRAESPVEK